MTNYNLNDSFQKLLGEMYFIYGGLRWQKTDAGYVHNGFVARNQQEMDLIIEHGRYALKNSLSDDGNRTIR